MRALLARPFAAMLRRRAAKRYAPLEELIRRELSALSALEKGDGRSALALEILAHGIKKIIGSYIAEMNGADAIVFTAGIGENDREMRESVCSDMDFLGIKINTDVNRNCPRGEDVDISAEGSPVKTLVIPTNEEYMIALDTQNLVIKNSERK